MNRKTYFIILFLFIACLSVEDVLAQKEEKESGESDEIKRNIEFRTFIPKGQWITGTNVSFSVTEAKDYNFLFVEKVSGKSHTVKVSPLVCYAFRDNQAAGIRGFYKRTHVKVDSLSFAIDDNISASAEDYYLLTDKFSGALIYRYYINIGKSQRFGLFNEFQLEVGGGHSKLMGGKGNDLKGTFQTARDYNISLVPGLVAFINDYAAAEVTVGVLGFNHSKTKQITNQIYEGKYSKSSGNFRVNIFSISLGLTFYL